jgi:large subunit ribosomal protein L4
MKVKVYNLEKKEVGDVDLNGSIFGLEPRGDIVKLVIDWQLAKARSGNHSTKTISGVSGTTKKPFKQKGTGNARQGSLRSVHMRGGGVSHGPVVRGYEYALPKKVRKLGLKHALSSKITEGKLLVLDSLVLESYKTAIVKSAMSKFGNGSFFVIDGDEINKGFLAAARNLYNVVLVPQIGANVYDIIKHDYVILTSAGLKALETRLGNE